MAQVFLDRFYIITIFDCQNSVCMAQIVKGCFRGTDLLDDPLEAIINGTVGKKASYTVGEDKIVFLPQIPRFKPLAVLLLLLQAKEPDNRGRQCQGAAFVVLCGREVCFPALAPLMAKLLPDRKCTMFKIHSPR